MSKQSEALRIADELLEMFGPTEIDERAAKELRRLHAENKKLKRDSARLQLLFSRAYVGIAPHPKPHEVWCLRLLNPKECNDDFYAVIDAAMEEKS